MTAEQLAKHRSGMGLTQEGMVELGHKRFETDARPIPAYIAHAVMALVLLAKHGLLLDFTKAIKRA